MPIATGCDDSPELAVRSALAGVRAVDPARLTREAIGRSNLGGENIAVVAMGKAAIAMFDGALAVLGKRVTRGVVIAPSATRHLPAGVQGCVGGHPIPSPAGLRAAESIEALADSLGASDTLVCLISGGASSLAMLPPANVSLDDVIWVTGELLRTGATIGELNCVRKHLDRLKGGRLARRAAPAHVVTLAISDVVGSAPDVIASGPTVPDSSTVAEAIGVLQAHDIWNRSPVRVRRYLAGASGESPGTGDPCFAKSEFLVVGDVGIAANAVCEAARDAGYASSIVTLGMAGEARLVGEQIAFDALRACRDAMRDGVKRCFVYGGECTVTVRGNGRGGRNQELALSAAIVLDRMRGCGGGEPSRASRIAIASIATDGVDGPTNAAGAVATPHTLTRARGLGCDAYLALATNDSHEFWDALGDAGGIVRTGPTGTNVMDLVVVTIA